MTKLSKTKLQKRPVKVAFEPADPRLVAYLYADLGFDQRTIARINGASIGSVEREVKHGKLVRYHPRHGEWSESLIRDLASRLGISLPSLGGVKPGEVWTKLRVALHKELPKALARDPKNRQELVRFFSALVYRQDAAKARLTRSRLAVLHGDLAMQPHEVARILDATPSAVRAALAREKIRYGVRVHSHLTPDRLEDLSHALGSANWCVDVLGSEGYLQRARMWPAVRARVGKGLLECVRHHHLDLSVLDRLIASIPGDAVTVPGGVRAKIQPKKAIPARPLTVVRSPKKKAA